MGQFMFVRFFRITKKLIKIEQMICDKISQIHIRIFCTLTMMVHRRQMRNS